MFYSLYVGLLIAAFVLFVATVILFFVWNVPNLHAELSGRKTKDRVRKLSEINKKNPEDFSTSELFYRSGGSTSGSLASDNVPGIDDEEEESALAGAIGLATGLFGRSREDATSNLETEQEPVEISQEPVVSPEPVIEPEYDDWARSSLNAGDATPKPPSTFPAISSDSDAYEEDSNTGVFDDNEDDVEDTWDGGAFSRSRRVIVVEEKTSLSR